MILLDTDHLTVLKYTDSERYVRLHGRLLAAAPELIGTTIIKAKTDRHPFGCTHARTSRHAKRAPRKLGDVDHAVGHAMSGKLPSRKVGVCHP